LVSSSHAFLLLTAAVFQNHRSFSFWPITHGGALWLSWALSPDAKRIAVTGCQELNDKVRIIDLLTGKQSELPIPSFIIGGLSWSPDGGALYGASQDVGFHFQLLHLDIAGKSQILFNRDNFLVGPVVSPDGRFLALGQQSEEANIYTLQNF
jgi:Tol biopolymer transport system component